MGHSYESLVECAGDELCQVHANFPYLGWYEEIMFNPSLIKKSLVPPTCPSLLRLCPKLCNFFFNGFPLKKKAFNDNAKTKLVFGSFPIVAVVTDLS